MSRLHALYRQQKNIISHNMDSYVALNSICTVKRDKTLSLCGVNSFIFFIFSLREVRTDLVHSLVHVILYVNFNPRLVTPKFQISCSQNWRLHNPRHAITKLQRARKLPPAAKSQHAKSPF